MLVEQEGEAFLAAEERIRLSARRAREVGDPAVVREAVRELPPDVQARMLRAFAPVLPAREHGRAAPPDPPPPRVRGEVTTPRESLAEAFERLEGVSEEELARRLEHVSLELVLTAHPTEATRRTLLRAHVRIAELLDRAATTPS